MFAPGHLGELTQIVPFEMVDEVLAETRSVQRRVRRLPSRVVMYLLPAGAPSSSVLSQARRRVGIAPLRALFWLLAGPPAGAVWWRGLLVCAVDGTTMSVPDSTADLAAYGHQSGSHGGSGYPLVRLVAVVACGTRTVLGAVFGPFTTGETSYAPELLGRLKAGMLLLADRNFAVKALVAAIAGRRAPAPCPAAGSASATTG